MEIAIIDQMYRYVHLGITLLMIGLLVSTWLRYQNLTANDTTKSSNSYSILFFALALFLWEFNLFFHDPAEPQYEVFTTIIADALLLVGTTFFNNRALMKGYKSKYSAIKVVPILSIVSIVLSNVFMLFSDGNMLIDFSICLLFTLVTFVIISVKLFFYYKNMNMIEIGIFAITAFMGLFTTLILSIAFPKTQDVNLFLAIKTFLLLSTVGVYFILANLAYSFLQETVNHQFVKVFTTASNNNGTAVASQNTEQDINDLISNNKIEEVVEVLLASSRYDKERMTLLLLLANRLSSINTEKVRDTISDDDYRINRNKIVDSLITLVNDK